MSEKSFLPKDEYSVKLKIGSGSTCGDIGTSAYCGSKLNVQTDAKVNIPICDCSSPFYVGIKTNSYFDTKSDKAPNKGKLINSSLGFVNSKDSSVRNLKRY